MTRDEFLGRLGELLACLPAEQVEETKAFYAEAIADRMEDGMSEEEAVAAMGAPGEVAEATVPYSILIIKGITPLIEL